MSFAVLAFAAGVVLLQQQAALPSLAWAWALIPITALALRFRVACALLALSMGFMWAAACAQSRMADWLAPELEGRDLEVVAWWRACRRCSSAGCASSSRWSRRPAAST